MADFEYFANPWLARIQAIKHLQTSLYASPALYSSEISLLQLLNHHLCMNVLLKCQSQTRLHDQGELEFEGGDQDHGREGHQQLRRLPARYPGDRRLRVRRRWTDRRRILLPGGRAGQSLGALQRAGRDHHRRPHLLPEPGAQHLLLHPQLPVLPPRQARARPVRRRSRLAVVVSGCAEYVAVLLPAVAAAAHPVLHSTAVVSTHTVLHATATGVPAPTAADTVLHTAVTSSASIPFPSSAVALDAAGGATAAVVPISSFATDLYNTIAPALATTSVPVPFATASTPTTFPSLATITTSVFVTPSTTIVSLAFPAISFLSSRFTISSTLEIFPERSKYLVFFKRPTVR
ncbi:uncharacterized protein LOC133905022 isoform X1 [Phragmites australis]|uniref:uncharacterized protein LOC133905022 isoform X1 n=1 Tax=Phragmites australis TaxID=29695 RepID=UPI002D78433F|nr:uncharacterized protein LOC133905022 isoform X1 [Phragmites australis]